MTEETQKYIHDKGFDMINAPTQHREETPMTYNKLKIGVKTVEDVALELSALEKEDKMFYSKRAVLKALKEKDYIALRKISNYFYRVSGAYSRACNYLAQLYRYDWYIVPEIYDDTAKEEKIIKDYIKALKFLDNSYIKKLCGEIALSVVRDGCYYGYIIPSNDGLILQELPPDYCRVRYTVNNLPAVEFNMAYFDVKFNNVATRLKVLKMFPEDFAKGYTLYKTGKLKQDVYTPDEGSIYGGHVNGGWYLLEPGCCVKFNLNGSDIPVLAASIPAILDLDAAQELDRRKQMQQLLKILVQQLPLNKDGDLIFDVDEARDIHNNAVSMLRNAIGVDVITTFADIESIDISDSNTQTTRDDLEKVERQVYNAMGMSRNLWNTDGNLSLEKSILDDEGLMRNLVLQFAIFFDKITLAKNSSKNKYAFRLYMLETTQYNYKEMAKTYKEQVQMGYSKMLPQIALGHAQSSIINTIYFENEVLHLSQVMIPPLLSSTVNGQDILGNKNQTNTSNPQNSTGKTSAGQNGDSVGRPEKAEGEKSEKTIRNLESKS